MSNVTTGILEKASSNNAGFCSILVNGTWYSTYKTLHSDLEGKTVVVEYTTVDKGGNTYHNAKSVKVDASAPAAQASAPAPVATAGAYDARQQSIVMQSSYRTAVDLIGHLLAHDCLAFGQVKKADKMGVVLGFTDDLAKRIFDIGMNPEPFLKGDEVEEDVPEGDSSFNPLKA